MNGGTITFTVLKGATPVGTAAVSGTVSAGAASAVYSLPAGTPNGTYTLQAVYSGSTDFASSSDNKHSLTVAAVPIASVAPSTGINYGTLYLGSIVTKTVTLTNTGDATMTVNNPLIAIVKGGNSNEFITVNLCPKSLAAGKSCTMTVTFVAGPFYTAQTAMLMISDNAAGSPQSVPLTATVIDPVAQLSASSVNFGTVSTKNGSATKSITVTSAGGTALSIGKVSISGAGFSETDNCSQATLNPKASCLITVTYKPTAKGAAHGTLVVPDNALTGSQSVLLSGTGD